jgi:hypothetical protein
MLSRIFWIGIAGIALVGGIILQGGSGIFSWGDDADHQRSVAQRIETKVDAAIDRSFDKMEVVTVDGKQIDVPPETKRALAGAVGELVKAETDRAMLKVRDASEQEIDAADARVDRARADVDRLKDQIEQQKDVAIDQRDAIREQIREDVRETVRDAVRN